MTPDTIASDVGQALTRLSTHHRRLGHAVGIQSDVGRKGALESIAREAERLLAVVSDEIARLALEGGES